MAEPGDALRFGCPRASIELGRGEKRLAGLFELLFRSGCRASHHFSNLHRCSNTWTSLEQSVTNPLMNKRHRRKPFDSFFFRRC